MSDDGRVPSFVYELAHRVREALEAKGVRNRARKIVRETITTQSQLLLSVGEKNIQACRDHFAWSGGGDEGERPPYPDDINRGRVVRAKDWPLPMEHEIDKAPGCVLALAALNDYAAKNPTRFQKTDCQFFPLNPFERVDRGAVAAYCYVNDWVKAVGTLTREHASRLQEVINGAFEVLGVKTDPVRAHLKKLFPLGIPEDVDLRDAIIELDAMRGGGKSDRQILRDKMKISDTKVNALQGRIRKARGSGKTTLPPRR
jgi:hypothetical protein